MSEEMHVSRGLRESGPAYEHNAAADSRGDGATARAGAMAVRSVLIARPQHRVQLEDEEVIEGDAHVAQPPVNDDCVSRWAAAAARFSAGEVGSSVRIARQSSFVCLPRECRW